MRFGDFQSLKPHPDEHPTQPIEASQLADCVDAGLSGFDSLTAIAVTGSNAYLANSTGTTTIIRCNVGTTGVFSECADTGLTGDGNAYGLTVHGSSLYIGNDSTPRVRKCDIEADGSLSACSDAGFPAAMGLDAEEIRIVGSTAYVLHYGDGTVSKCDVADGSLSNCTDAGAPGLNSPEGFAISGDYMYIANGSAVLRCIVAGDGSLNECADSGAPNLSNSTQIAVRGSTVYITDSDDTVSLVRCTAAASDGLLTDCTSISGEPRSLFSIVLK